jgi:hypothetical protein
MRPRGALLFAALALACAHKSERAPAVCVGKCGFTPGIGTGVSPEGGAGPTGEGGTSSGESSVDLTGKVLLLNDDGSFSGGPLLADDVELKTEDAKGRDVTGTWNGSELSLKDVRSTPVLWVLATPKNPIADDALPALQPVSTEHPDAMGQVSVTLALVHASSIENILDLASVPLVQDSQKAQIILLLKQKASGSAAPPPVSGVTVKAASAEDVLYGASGGFSDTVSVTDATGIAVLANVSGAAWPGALVSVTFSGARSSGAKVPAVAGAVTLVTLTP